MMSDRVGMAVSALSVKPEDPMTQVIDPPACIDQDLVAIEGDEAKTLVEALVPTNILTPWESGGESYQLWARPLLPDEGGCPEQ